jgi:hypothetical protein
MKIEGSRVSAGRGYLGDNRGGDVLRWLTGMRLWQRRGGVCGLGIAHACSCR